MISLMQQIIGWFGGGNGIGALAGISAILTAAIIIAPVVAGYLVNMLRYLGMPLLNAISREFAIFFDHYLTIPGLFAHELSHLCLCVITGGEILEFNISANDNTAHGNISLRERGPWFIKAIQRSLTAVAPTLICFALSFFLLRIFWTRECSIWASIGIWYMVISLIGHANMSNADLQHYFGGVWIFIVPLFALFFISGQLI